jgi:hypothetical protein
MELKFTEELIEGYLRHGSNGEETVLKLVDVTGNSDDEVLAEILYEKFNRKTVTVRYFICPHKMTLGEAETRFLSELFGIGEIDGEMDAEYNMFYSDITGYLWTDEGIVIGGHDLLEELYSHNGKYLILLVEVHD